MDVHTGGFWGEDFEFDKKSGLFKPRDTGVSLVHTEDLFKAVDKTSRELSLSMSEASIIDALMSSMESFTLIQDKHGRKYVPVKEATNFLANWIEAINEKDFEYLTMRRGLKVNKMVDFEEFMESREYLSQKKSLRPAVKKALLDFYENYDSLIEVVFGGATGIGKTYMASMVMLFMVYRLSCYHNPQLEFFLAPGTSIVFSVQSASLNLAKKVAFDAIGGLCKQSPYFQEHFMYDKSVKSELRFPKGIYIFPLSGADTAALGLNLFGGILDELNFLQVVVNSSRAGAAALEGYDQAASIYNTIITRIKGRFQDKGKIPGKLLLLSSANYPGDFISRKEDEAKESQARFEKTQDIKDRPTIYVIKMAQWESIPEDRFTGEKFLLEVGNENKSTRILRSMDDAIDEEDVIHVPVEYLSEFRKDPEKSLRDIAGIAVGGKNLFIPYRSKIEDAQLNFEALYPNGQLFLYDSVVFQEVFHDMSCPDFSLLLNKEHLQELLLDTSAPFAAHADLGITGDATGLVISRITGYKLVPHSKILDPRSGTFIEVNDERMPVYTLHGVLQIKNGGGEVDIDVLTDFVIYLKQFINIKYATMDTFQSRTALQRLRKHGIVVGTVSTDTDVAPYTEMRSALKDDRILMPRHFIMAHELGSLQRLPDGKVDHPNSGSKDVSDAGACSCYVLLKREANFASVSRKAVGGIRGTHRMSTGRHIKNNSSQRISNGRIQSKLSKRRI